MSSKIKSKLIKYGCGVASVALFAILYLITQNYENAAQPDRYRLMCDALSVPGVLLILFGGLVWAINEGALLGVGYALRCGIFSLIPGKWPGKGEKYGEYVARKREKKMSGYGFLVYTGLMAVGGSLVFMALFYSAG